LPAEGNFGCTASPRDGFNCILRNQPPSRVYGL
jgi:hypothetical protein